MPCSRESNSGVAPGSAENQVTTKVVGKFLSLRPREDLLETNYSTRQGSIDYIKGLLRT